MTFRVTSKYGVVQDVAIQDCLWYELESTGWINVTLSDGTPARGILSTDQIRQLHILPWLQSPYPFHDHTILVKAKDAEIAQDDSVRPLHDYLIRPARRKIDLS